MALEVFQPGLPPTSRPLNSATSCLVPRPICVVVAISSTSILSAGLENCSTKRAAADPGLPISNPVRVRRCRSARPCRAISFSVMSNGTAP